MTYENLDEILELIAAEQDRLMKEDHMPPSPAWRLGRQKIAKNLGLDDAELKLKIKEWINKTRQEAEPIPWESIKNEANQKDLARREFWHLQPEMFEDILKILFQHDPIGICNHNAGASQYSIEVNTILPRLEKAFSAKDVHKIIYEEFVRWFNATGERNADKYEAIAQDIWNLLQEKRGRL